MANLFRKEGQTQVVDAQGNLQNFSGNLDTLPIYNPSIKPSVKAGDVGNVPPIDVSGTVQTPTDTGSGLVAGGDMIQQDIQKYLDAANQPQSETQSLYDQLLGSVSTASEGLTGRGSAQLQAEQQTGATQANKELADLNAQYLTRKAEYDKLITGIEAGAGRQGLTTSAVMGQQGAVSRAAASELGLLQAQILGKQGQVEQAQNAANRAVDLMYADREAVYNTRLKQLELVKDKLSGEEAKRAKALEYALNKEQKALEEERQNKKDILSIGLLVSKNQAPQSVVAKINSAKTYEEAINLASPYMVSPADKLDLQLKRLQIAKASKDLRGDGNDLLSIDEAQKLGVPYGTTRAQAIALQGKTPATEIQLSTLANAQTLFTKLTEKGGMNAPVGVKNISFKIPGTPYADFTAIEKTLKNQLTLDNLKYLKGPTSDKDIVFITSASTALNRNMSPKLYQKTLNDIITTLSKYSPEYQYSQAVTGLLNSVNDPYSSYTSQVLAQ